MIFEKDSYKDVLRSVLLLKKEHFGRSFTFQRMAEACRIEKAYLSRVLTGDGHLSQDQVYLACQYLGLSQPERRYVSLLHQYERSAVKKHKDEIEGELSALRKTQMRTEGHIRARTAAIDANDLAAYFLDPNAQLIHMFLTTETYGDDIDRIARCVGLRREEAVDVIGRLQRADIVELRDGRYSVRKSSLHLPAESPIYKSYRLALRLKSLERLQASQSDKAYSVSVVFSSTPAVRRVVHKEFLAFLKKVEDLVGQGDEEEVYQLNFDLISWGDQ